MGQITSGVGLISGIDTGDLINELISLDAAPVTLLQTNIASAQSQEQAYQTIETQLSSIQTVGNTLALPQTFQNSDANSSNQNVLTAVTTPGAAIGSYQFQVARLVSTQQTISAGFNNANNSLVGAGTITLEMGGGEASSQTSLASLNGGAGISSGQFRITDGSGNSTVINTAGSVSLDDIVNQINTAVGIDVHAAVGDNGLVLTDESGGTGALTVKDLNGGAAAQSLGIAGSAVGTITGTDINSISASTSLNQLNDGNGIVTTTPGQTDFTVTVSDGTAINVQLANATNIGDVINAINTAGAGKLTAAINSTGNGLQLTDTSGGAGAFTVTSAVGSQAAAGLGLTGAATGTTINGAPLVAGLDSVLVSSLNGGKGIPLGSISINDGVDPAGTIDLTGATSVSDIINLINNNTAGVKVQASLNAAGTGIQIVNTSGAAGNMVIGDVSSTTAAALGIAGTFAAGQTDTGVNLQRQYVSQNTLLNNYNGGQGVTPGQFTITNSNGVSATVDLTQGTFNTLGDVIRAINAKNIGVTASINANGNGLLLTDTAGGAVAMKVADISGSAATDLNIAGTAAGTTIDGAEQKTIAVTNTDTLASLQTKINALGFGVTASIINDGSSTSPYHLSLTAVNSGAAGRVVLDAGTTNLKFTNLVDGQDAAVFYGGTGAAQPLLVTSSKNQLTNLINGVTVSLVGASSSPVTLSITPDSSNVITQLQSFVTAFNSAVGTIDTDSQFNTSTNQGGVLLGDSTGQQVEQTLYNMISSVVNGAGPYKSLADIGITINTSGTTGSATLDFNQSAFQAAFGSNPTAVQNLFSQPTTGLGTEIANAMDSLNDPVNGRITLQTNTINTQIQQYQTQITQLNQILAQKRDQLQEEFNNMEETLSQLQSTSSILAGLSGIKSSTSSASSSGSSGSSSSSSGSSSSSTGSSSSA